MRVAAKPISTSRNITRIFIVLICSIIFSGANFSLAHAKQILAATCDSAEGQCFFIDNSSPKYRTGMTDQDAVKLSARLCRDQAGSCTSQHSCYRLATTEFLVIGVSRRTGTFSSLCSDKLTDAKKAAAKLVGQCLETGASFADCTFTAWAWGQGPANVHDDAIGQALHAQHTLRQAGTYQGKLDGIYGPSSRAAMQAYLLNYGIRQHLGELDGVALTHLDEFRRSGALPEIPVASSQVSDSRQTDPFGDPPATASAPLSNERVNDAQLLMGQPVTRGSQTVEALHSQELGKKSIPTWQPNTLDSYPSPKIAEPKSQFTPYKFGIGFIKSAALSLVAAAFGALTSKYGGRRLAARMFAVLVCFTLLLMFGFSIAFFLRDADLITPIWASIFAGFAGGYFYNKRQNVSQES